MISVIIPTLNECKGIKQVIHGFPEDYRSHDVKLYIVDGGSTDGTKEIVEDSRAELIEQRLKGGKGNGVKQGLNEVDSEIYVMIDADGTYDSKEMGRIVDPLIDGKAEHVIGRRYNRSKNAIPKLNLAGNYLFNLAVRISTDAEVSDMLSGYRAFTDFSLRHTKLTAPGFGIETEMTLSAVENKVPIEEVNIDYSQRKGESKLNPVSDGWRIMSTIIWGIRDINPLKFFTAASSIFFVLATYPSYLAISGYLANGKIVDLAPSLIASVLIIIGLQMLIFGMISDQVRRNEKRLSQG
jgi:dolichol-phosphate mannosyltransferase